MGYISKQRRKGKSDKPTRTFYKLYYHVVWTTKNKIPFITAEIEAPLKHYIYNKCGELEVHLLKINNTDNHIHSLMSLKPTHYLPDVIRDIKGSSSHFINNELHQGQNLYWQRGYGIVTVSEKDLNAVRKYIQHQKEHHQDNTVIKEFECTE